MIYSYSGLTPPSALLQQISAGQAAGVIFFGGNISSETQIASVIQQLRQAQQQSPVAVAAAADDRPGGRRGPAAARRPRMSEKQIGASKKPVSAASSAGTGAGQNLAGVGMNVNLAPVLDVYYKSGNFIDQFQRSYSSNASVVASCGMAFITAQQKTGVAATAKHFPGLGSATKSQNTDAGPVTLDVSLSGLRAKDEAPYPVAITAGVKLIMASWAVYPALDASNPAGLSPAVIQGELRARLGYQGVTITDAIEAGALAAFGSYGQRAVLAAQAGMDLLLCSAQDPSEGQAVVTALAGALDGGQLDSAAFNAAVQRVTALRNGLHRATPGPAAASTRRSRRRPMRRGGGRTARRPRCRATARAGTGPEARVDPREPAPGVHQVDDPDERVGAQRGDLAAEGLDELVVLAGQLAQVPGLADQGAQRAAAPVLGAEQVAVRQPGLVQDLAHLAAAVAARAQPDARHDVAEPGPAQPCPEHVPGGPFGLRGARDHDRPAAVPVRGDRGEAEDALGAVAQQPLGGRGEPPDGAPPDPLRAQPVVGRGAHQRLPGRLLLDPQPAEHVDERRRPGLPAGRRTSSPSTVNSTLRALSVPAAWRRSRVGGCSPRLASAMTTKILRTLDAELKFCRV